MSLAEGGQGPATWAEGLSGNILEPLVAGAGDTGV